MSHYTKCKTKIKSKSALLKALNDMGFSNSMMRVSEQAMQLEGYEGKLRDQTAEIIIPRHHVGGAANDIGFKLQEDGTWGAIISEYDSHSGVASHKSKYAKGTRGYDQDWLKSLNQRYAYHNLKDQATAQGFLIESEREENGQVYLELSTVFGG